MLNQAKILTNRGLVCSIKMRRELRDEQRTMAAVVLVTSVAGFCDPLCDRVAAGIARDDDRGISGDGEHGSSSNNNNHYSTLRHLLCSELKLPHRLITKWVTTSRHTRYQPHRRHGPLLVPQFPPRLDTANQLSIGQYLGLIEHGGTDPC